MICLFLILFFCYRMVAHGRADLHSQDQIDRLNQDLAPTAQYQASYFSNFKTYFIQTLGKFAGCSLAGGGLAAFILMPTFYAL
ncbi:hypothetical protein U9990_15755, partial [Lactiplantibacillus plantarum]|uniref:hypothetical protein n=1 Tax=Lactiplantibacillus plantarum TaxID=1590 RepID=UPI003F08EED6